MMETTTTLNTLPATVGPRDLSPAREAISRSEPFGRTGMALIVLAFLLAGHAWSLDAGLFLDDHAHYASLRTYDWSFRSAVESSRLAIVGEVLDLWGRPATGLKFFRPIAFWIMKAEYTLVGWQPAWMHAFSLGWHYLCALLVGALAMRCFGRRTWATVAACLMAIHPAHTATVYWIACQTELITTALLLAGVLAYARYAGWGRPGEAWFLASAPAGASPALRNPGHPGQPSPESRRGKGKQADGITPIDHGQSAGITQVDYGQVEGISQVNCDQAEGVTRAHGGQAEGITRIDCEQTEGTARVDRERSEGITRVDHERAEGNTWIDREQAGWGTFSRSHVTTFPPSHVATFPPSHFATFPLGLLAILCYALALGCRENAVLFPLVCWAGDRLCGTSRPRWLRWDHAAMIATLGGYFVLRTVMLGGFQMPVRPYVFPHTDPGFAYFIVTKSVYYTLGLFGFVPVIPMGGQAFFATRPLAFYGGFAAIIGLLVLIWEVYRFRRSLLWPAVWIALLVGPTLPVFASSHHLYLPGVGAVLLLTAGLAALGGLLRKAGPLPRIRKIGFGAILAAQAAGLTLMTWGSGFAFRAGTRAEDVFVREVIDRARPLRDGDHLFFINMPLLAYYAVPAIEAETGRKDLQGHMLTFSPDLMKMESPGSVEIIGDRQIRVRAPAGRAYFEGITGAALLEVLGLPAGVEWQPIDAGIFTVTPTRSGPGGIEELVFTFEKPIDSPEYHFFFGSPQFLAYPLEALRSR